MSTTNIASGLFNSLPGNLLTNQQIPKTGGGYWPHLIDFYIPNVPGGALSATIMLHGGGGTKEEFAQTNGICSTDPATTAGTNWNLLNIWRMLVAIPQGQCCDGIVTGAIPTYNPYGVTTPGSAAWDNHVLLSGVDDLDFIQDLHDFINATWGLPIVQVYGHSNGGMMVLRLWREAPLKFAHFGSVCGPPSNYYLSTPVTPTILRPFWSCFGSQDTVLDILDGPAGVGDHFYDDTLTLNPAQDTPADVSYNPDVFPYFFPTYLQGPWADYAWKVGVYTGGGETADPGGGVTTAAFSGTQTAWSNAGGEIQMLLVSNGQHPINTLQKALAERVLGLFWKFCLVS